ncbi:MAG: hypothetical protein IPG50_15755 [Myxococcales bacterium]|nr:hypothetical protein [Myxococcales bacterium]
MEFEGATVEGHRDEYGMRQGWFRFLNASGELIGTAHFRDDILHGQVVTLYRGLCVAELNYIDGLPHGPYRRRVHEDVYDVPKAAWEEGSFSCGLVSGIFRLRDESGNVLCSRDFGLTPRENDTLRACLKGGRLWGPADWFEHARELFANARLGEGLAAMARGVGDGGDPRTLRETLRRVAAPVTTAESIRRAAAVEKSGSARALLAALLRGAEPTSVLRRLAVLSREEASAAFLGASVALREWPLSPIVFRAVREARPGGDTSMVLEDAKTLELTHPDEAAVLRTLVRRLLNKVIPPAKHEPATVRSLARGDAPTLRLTDPPTIRRRASAVAASEL